MKGEAEDHFIAVFKDGVHRVLDGFLEAKRVDVRTAEIVPIRKTGEGEPVTNFDTEASPAGLKTG